MQPYKIIFFAVLTFLFTGVWTSCINRDRSAKSSQIIFDSIVVDRQIALLQRSDSTLPFADVKVAFTYPTKFRDKESLLRIQQIFQGTFFGDLQYDSLQPAEAVDQYLEAYTQRYRALSNTYYDDKIRLGGETPVWYWYYMNHSNRIEFQNDSLLSYAVEYSDYEGGAHGSYRITYVNIDLNRLVTLSEEDLFVPDYYKPLTDKIVRGLMTSYGVTEPDSLLMQGFFTIEDIIPNNNFWLNNEGIHYAYNQYEIAPYSMGVIHVTVPFDDLKEIIIPDGVISRYFLPKK